MDAGPRRDDLMSNGTVVACPSCGTRARVRKAAPGIPRCPACKAHLPWLVETDEAGFATETATPLAVLVDFWAPWCGPCHAVAPVLERLAARHAGKLKVVKVNVDESPELAARFAAQGIPLLVVLRDGVEAQRIVGAQPLPALESLLAPHLA
jgi:thioredoxin 2